MYGEPNSLLLSTAKWRVESETPDEDTGCQPNIVLRVLMTQDSFSDKRKWQIPRMPDLLKEI
jgi:hypothetical protein